MAQFADLTLLNDPVNIAAYRDIGPAEYMPHAFRPGIHHPRKPRARRPYDFAFVGTGFPSRVAFFHRMQLGGLNARLAGLWMDLPEDSPMRDWTALESDDCVDNDETARIYRQAKTSINIYRTEAEDAHAGQGWAMGPREVELAACQTWFCRDPRPESDETFPMLPSFGTPEEAGELIRWAVAHPAARDKAASAAREAIAGRTFENNARSLLRLLSRQPVRM